MSSTLFLDGARQLQDAPEQEGQVSGQQAPEHLWRPAMRQRGLSGTILVACTHNKQANSIVQCILVLLSLYCHLQEEFISTVWDNNNLPPPNPSDAPYNEPESLPTMQPQSSAAVHPDFGCALPAVPQ